MERIFTRYMCRCKYTCISGMRIMHDHLLRNDLDVNKRTSPNMLRTFIDFSASIPHPHPPPIVLRSLFSIVIRGLFYCFPRHTLNF